MTEDLIQLPDVQEVKEMLDIARRDIASEIEQDSELQPASQLLVQVMDIIDSKLTKFKSFDKLSQAEKIDVAAHLNFLQSLLEDFFMFDEDFDDFDDEDFEDAEEEEEEEER